MMTMWTPQLEGRDGPLYRRIADALADDVAAGRLPVGSQLPTHRELAWRLGVTVGTVSRGYAEAGRRGLIGGEVGRGTFVQQPDWPAARDGECLPELPRARVGRATSGQRWFLQHGARPPEDGADGSGDGRLDLSLNYPFGEPVADVLAAGLDGLGDPSLLTAIGGYQPANGMHRHREAGAVWLRRFGIDVDAESVMIVPGCQGGLSMSFLALCRPGDVVLHDALTWPGLHATAAPQGVRSVGLPMDEHGLLPDAFEAACREHRPRLLYTMPTLHNPTTISMPEQRRREIAAVAERHGVFVVEDDVYGFLPDSPLPPIRTVLPELGIYVTSLSKCLAPALRIGYLVAAPALMPRLAAAMRTSVLMTSSIAAEVASRAIASGAAAIATHRQREEARARQRLAAELLQGLPYRSGTTAFHGWLGVPAPWRVDDLVAALAARGIVVTPGAAFAGEARLPEAETHVRICLCAVADRARLGTALGIIADLLRSGAPQRLPVI